MIVFASPFLLAQAQTPAAAPAAPTAGLGFWIFLLAAMALAPFVLTMITSFAKLVVVGGILRHALGTQQIPPNTVITGLALILTIHVMAPVGMRIYARYESQPVVANEGTTDMIRRIATSAEGPMRDF